MGKIRRALISVTDKSGLVEFAKALASFGVEILSTGGTARLLKDNGISAVEISKYTGSPEILGGRVKTLHPKVHGGILFRRDDPAHVQQTTELNIPPIDLVVVNLYQFAQAIAKPNVQIDGAIEQIDIGGPTLLRASAKNFRDVTVICDPKDYTRVLAEMEKTNGGTTLPTRFVLAKKVFNLTSSYDRNIFEYLDGQTM
ncbi:MAG: IMP cyclohydrolase [Desulfovibrionales bacterium]|nr:IMP cyclohydrolase [Desulfovibrionales bacterium]